MKELVRDAVAQSPPRAYRLCPYCARPCRGAACRLHFDLLELDPNYGRTPVQKSNEPPTPTKSPGGSSTKGV